MMLRVLWSGAALALLLLVSALAFFYATGQELADVQRDVRIALGLPKKWKTNFYEDTSSKLPVPCPTNDPLVVVTGGQSNAGNSYGPVAPFEPDGRAVMIFEGRCFAATNPVLGVTGKGESLWPHFARQFVQATGREIVLINGAIGTTQVSDWLDDRSNYRSRLVKAIRSAKQLGYTPDLVLWIQGETDAAVQVDPESFVYDLERLIQTIEQESAIDGKPQWILYRSTRCMDRPNNGPAIESALAKLASQPGDKLHLGPSLTKFDNSMRRDKCHLGSGPIKVLA